MQGHGGGGGAAERIGTAAGCGGRGRESVREPGLEPRGPKGGGAGAGRDGLARKRARSDRQQGPGPTPSFKPASARTTTTFRLRHRPAHSERKLRDPSSGAGRWLPDTSFRTVPSSHWLLYPGLLKPPCYWWKCLSFQLLAPPNSRGQALSQPQRSLADKDVSQRDNRVVMVNGGVGA